MFNQNHISNRFIDSPERMVEAVHRYGIIPLFRSAVPGWSIEDMTAPGCWFDEGDTLGPWDWKVDVVAEGDIAYGKFLGGKAAFATIPLYRELMIWRRSLPKYRAALGEGKPDTLGQLSATALKALREAGVMESKDLRKICGVKKNVMDSVMQFLQMGTWAVIGDIQRVYRGPDLHYSGWQTAMHTTPDSIFGDDSPAPADAPFWVKLMEQDSAPKQPQLTPAEAREHLISHIQGFFPDASRPTLERII